MMNLTSSKKGPNAILGVHLVYIYNVYNTTVYAQYIFDEIHVPIYFGKKK